MFDFTGTRFDFTVAEGMSERIALRIAKSETAEALDLSGSTWQMRAENAGSERGVTGLTVEHGEADGELVLMLPGLVAGEYRYEIFATAEGGEASRVLYGVMTAITSEHGAELVQAAGKAVTRTLDVVVPVVNGAHLELRWVSCSVAEAAAARAVEAVDDAKAEADRAKQEADRAENEADRAEGAAGGVRDELTGLISRADAAVAQVEKMEGRLDAIDNHIMQSVVPNPVTNTWWIAGKDTHYQVTGDAGRSPYLNDGNYWMFWDDTLKEYINSGINARGEDGRCPMIGSNGNWLHWNQAGQVWEDTGVQAMGKDGINGSAVRRIIVDAVGDIPTEGETCNGGFYYYVPLASATPDARYEVYAWLEHPDGTSGWVCVGEANDIATSEIYGLVKTGTDVVVDVGAPVGVNANGQMSVPMAETANPGAVKLSFADTLASGGRIGYDANKRVLGEPAGLNKYGDVKVSYSGDQMTNGSGNETIGLRSDGSLGVRWATLEAPGVVRLGSRFGQLNRIPYQQGVGCTTDHQIVNNLLFGGALKHQKFGAWTSKASNGSWMKWLEDLDANISSSDRQYLNDVDYYFGLYTSEQFEQSETEGLVLLPATAEMLAGVYVAGSMADARDAAVPEAKTVKAWSLDTHYAKSETYNKVEVDDKLDLKVDKAEIQAYKNTVNQAIETHNRTVAQTLSSYDSYIHSQLYTKSEFNRAKEVFMTRTENWHGSEVISENAYNALETVDAETMYFLTDEE